MRVPGAAGASASHPHDGNYERMKDTNRGKKQFTRGRVSWLRGGGAVNAGQMVVQLGCQIINVHGESPV